MNNIKSFDLSMGLKNIYENVEKYYIKLKQVKG